MMPEERASAVVEAMAENGVRLNSRGERGMAELVAAAIREAEQAMWERCRQLLADMEPLTDWVHDGDGSWQEEESASSFQDKVLAAIDKMKPTEDKL